jgi:hypothetical protein
MPNQGKYQFFHQQLGQCMLLKKNVAFVNQTTGPACDIKYPLSAYRLRIKICTVKGESLEEEFGKN